MYWQLEQKNTINTVIFIDWNEDIESWLNVKSQHVSTTHIITSDEVQHFQQRTVRLDHVLIVEQSGCCKVDLLFVDNAAHDFW